CSNTACSVSTPAWAWPARKMSLATATDSSVLEFQTPRLRSRRERSILHRRLLEQESGQCRTSSAHQVTFESLLSCKVLNPRNSRTGCAYFASAVGAHNDVRLHRQRISSFQDQKLPRVKRVRLDANENLTRTGSGIGWSIAIMLASAPPEFAR